ncbi:DnaJ homolog subfamily C member 5 homolog [Gryllus bimaculatus]|nr:DnaJ homolog subfamily C member 5 homolog [Gryllus bimaculatus]
MALTQDELFKLDLYDILGLEVKCTLQEVKRAFRKKALKCHPDKNPDDPNAAQLFHQLSCALEILSDELARAAYDKVLNARKAAQIRNQQLDSRRKKLKEDLEERERNVRSEPGSIFRNEEQKLKEQLKTFDTNKSKFYEDSDDDDIDIIRLTVQWKAEKGDASNGGYSYSVLYNILSEYGEIAALVISPKKRGRAIVEFKTPEAVSKVLKSLIGLPNNPLKIEILGLPDSMKNDASASSEQKESTKKDSVFPSFSSMNYQTKSDNVSSKLSFGKSAPLTNDEMLENAVLQRLRNMEQMKRAAAENAASK